MRLNYMIGDIVQCIFDPTITGMVVGYGNGKVFTYMRDDTHVVLAMREDGSILTFSLNSGDYKVVNHVNMGDVFECIVNAKKEVG